MARDAAVVAAGEILQTAPQARMHVKRMLNERYGLIDFQTMTWALQTSPELREGMRAFMEKRSPAWIPQEL
ncbi:hypothetical protein CC117_17310 [Parafrankia colletiae]|uniref:Enoyl-CoA hydratase n=1 Tax=Parafrankia colletiae TaxID=573497 RepID=A0A1S1QPI9_9ACTN|nr:hypothetical protein [Parafrankia colletiae]MCK9903664.1 hypothetical protein [Frankia sp. Cpl3]OHV36658.1 hypothetical protein CC117_17310 [Parafrankia colletiae]